ncbi:hypothetical protein JTB14_029230 [Gonioctena quinquepunctata]|nr:hypothetical protein JTB14_029230 [Gonioctena quinquepunctata]
MVVPIERVCRSEKLKKYVGNNLLLNITHNKITLAVTGNNCTIRIDENSGWIKVVGDNCDVTVLKGSANIDYVGNFGKIHLGSGVAEETVTYIGNEGEISTVKEAANTILLVIKGLRKQRM